ncbi:hypothetical protein Hanom_Chr01g00012221 [Helianthus anomalus]
MSDQFRLEVLTIQPFRGKCLNHSDICSRNKQSEPLSVEPVIQDNSLNESSPSRARAFICYTSSSSSLVELGLGSFAPLI